MVYLPVDACGTETVTVSHVGNQTLDANDALQYVLHTSAGPLLGAVLAESSTPSFALPFIGFYEQIYYISAIVGNDLGGGNVDTFDPCLSVSIGVPVTWHQIPTVTMVEETVEACPGELVWFTINSTGTGPWTYSLTNNGEPFGPPLQGIGQQYVGNFGGPDTMVVCVTNASNSFCQGIASGCVTANISELPECTLTVTTAPDCQGFANGAISVSCTGGYEPINYSWSNGATSPSLQNLASGNYSLTVTNGTGCSRVYNALVNYTQPLTVNLLLIDSLKCFDNNGIIAKSISGGTPPYTFLWYGPNNLVTNTPLLSINSPGIYSLVAADVNGCSAEKSILVESDDVECGTITGSVISESDGNCVFDAGEFGLQNWLVRATGSLGVEFYGTTDAFGHYSFKAPQDGYLVEALPPANLWDACFPPAQIVLTGMNDSVNVDFHFHDLYSCPLIDVDVSTPFLRRCFSNVYSVSYCNQGTETAFNAAIEVQLDPLIQLDSAQIPFVASMNNSYTFEIGDLAPGECNSFHLFTKVLCNAVLGQTLCAEAHAYPDSLCGPADPNWSGAFVEGTSECTADSVIFTLTNTGTGDMDEPSYFIVVQDGVMLMTQEFELEAGGSTMVSYPATGATYSLLAEQVPDAPGNSQPSLFVEGWGGNGSFSTGYALQFPENDADPFLSIDCQEVIGSYDPNDKRGYPLGFGPNHLIEEGQALDYHIRFQNTGTDTAFTVVVKDVIDPSLDIATLRPGAASHPYQLDIHQDTLIFTFDDILLPDSNINEPASHGFVKLNIGQRAALPLGTVIENKAAIYFDFNAPVITNRTRHQVGEPFIVSAVQPPVLRSKTSCTVYPNPMGEEAVVLLQGAENQQFELRLYDGLGRYLRSEKIRGSMGQIRKDGLADGLYFYEIITNGLVVGQGKVAMR
ncbi:MAG: T9SS type A sorting domain-containing protein [Saprospiraceae bacterium]|nr:T9SS type A sorting domain-containing protein [Saprospiraceae bacterium]